MEITRYRDICLQDDSLRDYQQQAKKSIFQTWDSMDHVMFQMPTGTGKTRLFTSIIHDINRYSISVKQPVKILIIAHRTELIDQIDQSLFRYSVAHGIIAGGQERNLKMPVQVASIQTLTNKNNLEQAKKLNVQFVIIDEAHHSLARTYKKLWELYPEAKILGVTATPWRMNGSGFLSLYDKLIKSLTIKKFIDKGWLSVYKYYSLREEDPIQQKIDSIHEFDIEGDYKIEALEREIDITGIRAQLLKSYQTLAEGKKGIIYSISREHSKHICADFEEAGIMIVNIDSETPATKRKQMVSDFRMGKIDIIVNVDIFSEGFDCPDIEFIQLARPTRSLAKYLQQVGRGLRVTKNKQACIILDNVGLYNRFGLPDANRHWDYHFEGRGEEEPDRPIIPTGDGEVIERDFSEGDESMVLVENLVKEDNLDVVSLLANSEELYNLLRKWVIEPDNNSIISFATKVQENHKDKLKYFFEAIKRVIGSGITADQYLNFIACMLNCDAHVYMTSIANAGYQPNDKLSENGAEMLNALVDTMFGSQKINSAFSVVIPFSDYLTSDSLNQIRKRGHLLTLPYHLIMLAYRVLNLSPKQAMDYLLSMKTQASYFAIYQVLFSSKKNHIYSFSEIQQIKSRIGKETFAQKLIGRLIDYSVLGVKNLVIENIDEFEAGNYDLFAGITSSVQSKIEARQIDKKTWLGKVYPTRYICSYPHFSSFSAAGISANILVPNEYLPEHISKETLLPFRMIKVFENSNYTIGCPPDCRVDLSDIAKIPLIDIGSEVELRFKIWNRTLIAIVKGFPMVRGKLLYAPKNFNYKIQHKAVAIRRTSFFDYTFKIIDTPKNVK